MKKVMVLGWGGYIGKHFQEFVIRNNLDASYDFVGVGRREHESMGSFRGIVADASNGNAMIDLFLNENPEYVLNLVGNTNKTHESIIVTENIIKAAGQIKTRVLHVGSAAEYGNPRSLPVQESDVPRPLTSYGIAKLLQAEVALSRGREYGVPVIVTRLFNVISKNQLGSFVVGSFIRQVRDSLNGGVIDVGDLETRRDFLSIEDAIMAFWTLLLEGREGKIYNTCSGVSTRVGDILDLLIKQSGKNLQTRKDPNRFLNVDIPDIYGDNSKLRGMGWKQTKTWEESLSIL